MFITADMLLDNGIHGFILIEHPVCMFDNQAYTVITRKFCSMDEVKDLFKNSVGTIIIKEHEDLGHTICMRYCDTGKDLSKYQTHPNFSGLFKSYVRRLHNVPH